MNASREITVVTYVRIELPLFSKADCCFEDCTGISPEDLISVGDHIQRRLYYAAAVVKRARERNWQVVFNYDSLEFEPSCDIQSLGQAEHLVRKLLDGLDFDVEDFIIEEHERIVD